MEQFINKVICGDCLQVMKGIPDNSVDSIVTDPPAGISFMGKSWDTDKGGRDNWIKWMQEVATECKRVLKPGGHAFVWAIPRTSHWTATAWENAGFEIRDVVAHVFGSGFPKSLNIGKAVDKLGIRDNNKEIEFAKMLKKYKTNDVINKIDKKLGTKFRAFHFFSTPDTVRQLPSREDWVVIKEVINTNFKVGDVVYVLSGNNEIGQPTMIGNCGVISSFGTRYKVKGLDTIEVFVDFKKTDYSSEKGYYNETHVFNDYHLTKNISELNIWDEYILNRQLDLTKIREIQGYEKSIKNWDKKYIKPILNKPATEQAKQWEGWGTALKPAREDWLLMRKPLDKGLTIAENCLKWGTGGINIDESRVESNEDMSGIKAFGSMPENKTDDRGFSRPWMNDKQSILDKQNAAIDKMKNLGRFPANLILGADENGVHEEVRECFPDSKSQGHWSKTKTTGFGEFGNGSSEYLGVGEKDKEGGNASRFFKSILYYPKASKSERNAGLDVIEDKNKRPQGEAFGDGSAITEHSERKGNFHPTVKPIALMEYLIKMITPKGGTCLDPFSGSFSTGVACVRNGFGFIGIEREEEYVVIGKARLEQAQKEREDELKNVGLFQNL